MSHTADDARHLPAPNPPEPTSAPPTQPAAPVSAGASLSLDGELPRLGSATMTAPAPQAVEHAEEPPAASPTPAGLDLPGLPTLPTAAPVLTPPTGIPAPDAGHASSGPGDREAATSASAAGAHPMAHAMPAKSPQSEASRKAAEIRAAKKAKARKVKIGVALGAIVVTAVVGPPLFRWFSDAINEAGSTSTEQPAD